VKGNDTDNAANPTGRRLRPRFVTVLALVLLAGFWGQPVFSAESKTYEALRLLTEAFYEISQKYVWPRGEEEMLRGALRGMLNSLDPDSSFLTPEEYRDYQKGEGGPEAEAGLELVVKEHLLAVVAVLDGGPAAKAGIRPGDLLLKINGQMVRNLTTQEVSRRFRGAAGTVVKVQVMRNGLIKPLDLAVSLAPLARPKITAQAVKEAFIYVRIPYFTDDTPAELATVLKDLKRRQPQLKGLILDLRNNARGSMEQGVRTASVLLGDKEIVSTRGRKGGGQVSYRGKPRDLVLDYSLPMVVLVDQGTARAAEIVVAALRHYKLASLLGAKTFGLCGITKAFPLKDGSALVMTVAHCYTPEGQRITGVGLEPQEAGKKPPPGAGPPPVPPPMAEEDPWVQQAVELLKGGKTLTMDYPKG